MRPENGDRVSKSDKICHIFRIRQFFLYKYEKYGTLFIYFRGILVKLIAIKTSGKTSGKRLPLYLLLYAYNFKLFSFSAIECRAIGIVTKLDFIIYLI